MKSTQRLGCPARGWLPLLALWGIIAGASSVVAQSDTPTEAALPPRPGTATASAVTDPAVVPAGCSSCGGGGGLIGDMGPGPLGDGGCGCGCGGGCGGCPCYPGYEPCDCCNEGDNCVSRFLHGVYHCICCPDPCYRPQWVPLANAAFFTDPARPITQIRLRGDFAGQFQFPDKAEWFWPKENAKGPHFPGTVPPGAKPPGEPNVDYGEGYLYTEGAVERFGAWVEMSYRNVEPTLYPGASGFGDMNVGTKSLLLDCELIQFTFQFKTYIPTGNFTKGLGTGHTSLEPSLITAIKLTSWTYFQAQTAYWFPLGGDRDYEGPVFHYHLSLNQLLCNCGHDVQLIGTAELSGYDIAGGAYTSPVDGLPHSAKDVTNIVNVGPGLRLVICNKIDIGAGSQFAISKDRMAEALARIEFRWRF